MLNFEPAKDVQDRPGMYILYIVVKNVANPNFKSGSFTWLALGYWQLPV
jgi:hypothetical protein